MTLFFRRAFSRTHVTSLSGRGEKRGNGGDAPGFATADVGNDAGESFVDVAAIPGHATSHIDGSRVEWHHLNATACACSCRRVVTGRQRSGGCGRSALEGREPPRTATSVRRMSRPVPPQVIPRPSGWRRGRPAPWADLAKSRRVEIGIARSWRLSPPPASSDRHQRSRVWTASSGRR